MVTEPDDYAEFRILPARCPSGSKKNAIILDSTNGITRYRFTLGEVLSWNIDLDVIVGNGYTRITLREIPKFIMDSFEFIIQNGLQIDGIFRKEGNSARLNRPEVLDVYRGVRDIPSDFTVLDVCTMVKRFLKDLKPTLLDSDGVRSNIIKRARDAKNINVFKLTHLEMVEIFESPNRQMSPSHLGTLGYVMRLLNRIAKHSETHKMTTDNLAVVLVGSVFGEYMTSGGTESRKKMQQMKKCSEAELQSKREDMSVQVAAVKMLIINANLIALPHGHYVSSNRLHLNNNQNVRSTSAMPNIRCTSLSSDDELSPPQNTVFNMAKASLMHQNHPGSPNSRPMLTRRDSDSTHIKVAKNSRTKRSSSFLPSSLRDLRDKVSYHLKRNKSPSPDKNSQTRRHVFSPFSSITPSGIFSAPPSFSPTTSSRLPPPPPQPTTNRVKSPSFSLRNVDTEDADSDNYMHSKNGRKNGSTSSGRQSRAHTKKGNINSARCCDSDSQKSFQMSPGGGEKRPSISSSSSTVTNRSLRRTSNNSHYENNHQNQGEMTPSKKKKPASLVIRRNTSDGIQNIQNQVKKRASARRPTFWGVDTITEEEKENNRKSQVMMDNVEDGEEAQVLNDTTGIEEISVLEMMSQKARHRRIGVAERRQRRIAAIPNPSESMMGLNGYEMTLTNENILDVTKKNEEKDVGRSQFEQFTPVFQRTDVLSAKSAVAHGNAKSRIGQQLEREMKQRLDVVATPMISRRTDAIPLRKLDSIRLQQNGQVWVGKTQTFVSVPKTPETEIENKEKVSPILARSPLFRSSTPRESPKFFGFRSKSHLTGDRVFSNQEYAALATPPRERRLPIRQIPGETNIIYSSPTSKNLGIVRSSSLMDRSPVSSYKENRQVMMPIISPLVDRNSKESFKCPQLLPMKTHESKERKIEKKETAPVQNSSEFDLDEHGFGDYNDLLKNSNEDTKFATPTSKLLVESRPSVTALQYGLVQSRINHFQTIEQKRISISSSSGTAGRPSSISLKSIDSTISSTGKN